MTKNPLHITYNDLIREIERELDTRQRIYPGWKLQGKITANIAAHRIEIMKVLLQMLKKSQHIPPQQINLFESFQDLKH